MSTTEKLQNVLTAKNAIRDKFNLGDIPFAKYAENIKSGGGADFYLCGYVNRNYVTYDTFVVSGFPEAPFVGGTYTDYDTGETKDLPADVANRNPNGTYTLQNPDAQYVSEYYWQSENGCVIDHWSMAMGQPAIYPGKEYTGSSNFFHVSFEDQNGEYPVPENADSYVWWYSRNGASDTVVEGGSVTVPVPPEVEKYWEGYKLVLNDEGKYDLAAEKTKLTYADYMPVTGRIYDASSTAEITNANLSDDALWSCPHGMTSNENDEWKVSASSEVYSSWHDETRYAYFAFDDNNGSRWESEYTTSDNPEFWLQWQNKKRAVVVRQISFYLDDQNDLNTVSYLQGSNDGVTWTDIIRGQVGYPNTEKGEGSVEYVNGQTKVTRYFKGNAPCYKYWKLGRTTNSGRAIIYSIEAYSQLPREVPR